MHTLNQPDASIDVEELPGGVRRITVHPRKADLFVPRASCETHYSPELIEHILRVKGAAYLCDEIGRDEDPAYVQRDLEMDLRAYFDESDFTGKRILDFGCGSGASTMVLARMFPQTEIVGVELFDELLSVARARARFYHLSNVKLLLSPSGEELPPDVGEFDFVIMSAVYEHLLPNERRTVLPRVWATLKQGGYLFLNLTPYRHFPIEHHTTGLPLLNYLPPRIALSAARKFSNRIDKTEPWEMLLRRGIRGGTEYEILRILRDGSKQQAILLEPTKQGLRDRIDLWHAALSADRLRPVKQAIKTGLKGLKLFTGLTLVPNLSLVIQKGGN